MNNNIKLINEKAKYYSQKLWNLELDIPVIINNRLRSTQGQMFDYEGYKSEIQLSKQILDNEYYLDDVLLHELCHWACKRIDKDYRDHSKTFEDELKRIGASSTETTDIKNGEYLFNYSYGQYICNICNREFETKDYLEEEKIGEKGRKIKDYYCCGSKMKYRGSTYKMETYIPNNKIIQINNDFKNLVKEKYYANR